MSLPTNKKPLRSAINTGLNTLTDSLGVASDLIATAKSHTMVMKIEAELEAIEELAILMGWDADTVIRHKAVVSDKYFPELLA